MDHDDERIATARAVKRLYSLELLTRPDVVKVGIGRKSVGGVLTDRIAIIVEVTKKNPLSTIPKGEQLPCTIDGVPVDVVENKGSSGSPAPINVRRVRPVPPGVSISHYRGGAGTLGGWWRIKESGDIFLVSNWHVIANSGDCQKGDPILQPAVSDGGRFPEDVIAYLDHWNDVRMIVPTCDIIEAKRRLRELLDANEEVPTNRIDIALASPVSEDVIAEVTDFGEDGTPIRDLMVGDAVRKTGRTTGTTRGAVTLLDVDVLVIYPSGVAVFVDQIAMA